jgi:hypothetical protein
MAQASARAVNASMPMVALLMDTILLSTVRMLVPGLPGIVADTGGL